MGTSCIPVLMSADDEELMHTDGIWSGSCSAVFTVCVGVSLVEVEVEVNRVGRWYIYTAYQQGDPVLLCQLVRPTQ